MTNLEIECLVEDCYHNSDNVCQNPDYIRINEIGEVECVDYFEEDEINDERHRIVKLPFRERFFRVILRSFSF